MGAVRQVTIGQVRALPRRERRKIWRTAFTYMNPDMSGVDSRAERRQEFLKVWEQFRQIEPGIIKAAGREVETEPEVKEATHNV